VPYLFWKVWEICDMCCSVKCLLPYLWKVSHPLRCVVFYFRAGLCLFPKRALDAHLFTFFRACSYCSILFFEVLATLSVVNLFRAKKESRCCFYPLFSEQVLPFQVVVHLMTLSSSGGDSIIFQFISYMCVVILQVIIFFRWCVCVWWFRRWLIF